MPVQQIKGPKNQSKLSYEQKVLILKAIDSVVELINDLGQRIVHLQEKTAHAEKINNTNTHQLNLSERCIAEIQMSQATIKETLKIHESSLEGIEDSINMCKMGFAEIKKKCEDTKYDMEKIRQDQIKIEERSNSIKSETTHVIMEDNDSQKTPNPYIFKINSINAPSNYQQKLINTPEQRPIILTENDKSVENSLQINESEQEVFLSLSFLSDDPLEISKSDRVPRHSLKMSENLDKPSHFLYDEDSFSIRHYSYLVKDHQEKVLEKETIDSNRIILNDKSQESDFIDSFKALFIETTQLIEQYKYFQNQITSLMSTFEPNNSEKELNKLSRISLGVNSWHDGLWKILKNLEHVRDLNHQDEIIKNLSITQTIMHARMSLKSYEKRLIEMEKLLKKEPMNVSSENEVVLANPETLIDRVKNCYNYVKSSIIKLFPVRDLSFYKGSLSMISKEQDSNKFT